MAAEILVTSQRLVTNLSESGASYPPGVAKGVNSVPSRGDGRNQEPGDMTVS